ncbi:glycerol-3-phosphate acyltransferase 3 [Tanacetum coccineum]
MYISQSVLSKILLLGIYIYLRQSFITHLLQMMYSWVVVCDVWYLEPQKIKPREASIQFAERVSEEATRYGGQLTDLPSNIKALLAAKDNVGDGTTDVVLLAGKFSTEANPFIKDGVINKIKELAASIKGKTLVEKSNASNMETERCQPKRSHMGGMISLTLDADTLQFRRRQKAGQSSRSHRR